MLDVHWRRVISLTEVVSPSDGLHDSRLFVKFLGNNVIFAGPNVCDLHHIQS